MNHYDSVVKSPDSHVVIRFTLQPRGPGMQDDRDCPFYSITYKNRNVVLDSRLGLEIGGAAEFSSDFEIVDVTHRTHDEEWKPVYGERAVIPDRYNEMQIDLREKIPPQRRLRLMFRAYNEGAAFCYSLPDQPAWTSFTITKENTHFHFPKGAMGYAEYHMEAPYEKVAIEEIRKGCERPLTVEYPDGMVACLTEARVDDYSRMMLSPAGENEPVLVSDLSGAVQGTTPFTTPWRVLIVGDRPGDLIERNHIILNLNPPCRIEEPSWIKPGKLIREVTLSTSGGMACVDFACDHHLSYIHYDAGWYGHEHKHESDATRVYPDPLRVNKIPDYDGLDLPRVIEYAKKHGIGVWLYVNRRALERQMDELLPLYEQWGVKGIKAGFVNVGPQTWTKWLHDLVRKAARYHLMVDVHDEYRPTGFSRTYPNFLTQEGVRGNEHMPTARHNVTLPFTRYPAGAADYTPCYYSKGIKTTHAHQLALPVVFYSPAMFLFWYDRPADFQGEAEIEFWDHLPTVWDDTRVVQGEIGNFVTIARRNGKEWYVGSLTNEDARELEIPLAFLEEGAPYLASVYSDADQDDPTRTHVRTSQHLVDSSTVLKAVMAPSGGQAIRIIPKHDG